MSAAENDQAIRFKNEFDPVEGVDYSWVLKYSKEQVADWGKAFEDVDAKADKAMGYIGNFSGLTALATAASVVSNVAHPAVACAAIPSFVCGAIAVGLLLRSRMSMPMPAPPTIKSAVEYAEFFDKPGMSEVAFLPAWHMCQIAMKPALKQKGRWLNYGYRAMIASVVSLSLPVFASFFWQKAESKPSTSQSSEYKLTITSPATR